METGAASSEENSLLSQSAAQLRIHYNAYDDVGKVHVSAHIIRSDGTTCCQMRTKLDNIDITVGKGQGVVTVDLNPLQLISGTYYANAAFLDERDSKGIVRGRSNWFFVKGLGFSYEDSSGVYEPLTVWQHHNAGTDKLREVSANGSEQTHLVVKEVNV